MDNERLAEVALRMVCGRTRATEIMGDLLEQKESTTTIWWSVLAVVVAKTWRWPLAFAVTSVSMLFLLVQYTQLYIGAQQQEVSPLPGGDWILAALCCWSVLILNLVRYGWRDRINAVALGAFAVLTATAFVWKTGGSRYTLAAVAVAGLLCFFTKALRRSLLCISLSALSFACVFAGLVRVGIRNPVSPLCMEVELMAMWVGSLAVEGWVLRHSRRLLLSR